MANEAVFTRADTPEGTRFDITPADAPAGSILFLKTGSGCLGLFWGVILGLIAAAVVRIVITMPLSVAGAPAFGNSIGFLAGCAAFVFVVLAVMRRYSRRSGKLDQKREKVSLVVTPQGIRHPGGLLPAGDIAELLLRHPHDRGGYSAAQVVPDGVSAAGYNAGARMGTEIRNRSFALMARRRSISTPEILAQGLTWNAGEALLNDVTEAMK